MKYLFQLSFALVGDFLQCTVHSWPAFGTILRITGSFQKQLFLESQAAIEKSGTSSLMRVNGRTISK
jgi:hypothetical protein